MSVQSSGSSTYITKVGWMGNAWINNVWSKRHGSDLSNISLLVKGSSYRLTWGYKKTEYSMLLDLVFRDDF